MRLLPSVGRFPFALRVALLALALAVPAQPWSPSTVGSTTFTPIRWTANPTVRVSPAHGTNVQGTNADVVAAISGAAATWSSVTGSTLRVTMGANSSAVSRNGGDSTNTVLLQDTLSSSQMGGALAVCYTSFQLNGSLRDADIVFNTSYDFTTTAPSSNGYDLQSVATHEMGHLAGLDHSSVLHATMFQTTAPNTSTQRTLGDDDIAGIRATYPDSTYSSRCGSINGRVRTGSAGVLGASVFAVDAMGSVQAAAITHDAAGSFTIAGLTPGVYSLGVEPLDGPMTQSNIGGYYARIGTFNASFQTRAAAGAFTVNPGAVASAGDQFVVGLSPTVNPGQNIGLTFPGATSFFYNSAVSVEAGAANKQLLVVNGNGVTSSTAVAVSGGDVTLTLARTGTFTNGVGFRIFDIRIPSTARPGARTIAFINGAETANLQGAFEVAATASSTNPNTAVRAGCEDVNRDGAVNLLDLRRVQNVILGSAIASAEDINGDGSVNAIDLRRVVNVILGRSLPDLACQ